LLSAVYFLQAHKNLNRIFFALGGYVAATCGAKHATKQAAK
jgi:hypothetical protein